MSRQQAVIARVQQQGRKYEAEQSALSMIELSVISLETSANTLKSADSFTKFKATGGSDSFRVSTSKNSTPGEYSVRSVRLASTQTTVTRGFSSPEANLGGGTVTVRTGGELNRPVKLDLLNGGAGINRGTIRIADRTGESADVDLSTVTRIDEVVDAINGAGVGVTARTEGDRLVLSDTTNGTGTMTVSDIKGSSAAGLGIAGSATGDTLTGMDVLEVTTDFGLELLNDGMGPKLFKGAPDIKLTDSTGATFDVNLDEATTVGGVIDAINEASGGTIVASLDDDRLVLTDTAGGAGTPVIENVNGSFAVAELGLNVSATGGVLTGKRLSAGLNSTLLRNLNGGQGIETPGTITITNRTGETATVDLSNAVTLDDVTAAINSALSSGGGQLNVVASVDEVGTGLVLRDTSGGSGNLIVADGSGTVAADLGIVANAATDTVSGGPLNRRFVGNATSLSTYARDGQTFEPGSIQITDSAGNTASVNMSSVVRTVGDAISRINSTAGISVRAELNETGDGFVLIDEAGGAGALTVEDVDGTTAADLRLDGAVQTGSDGAQRISSRFAAVVELQPGETLSDLQTRLAEEANFLKTGVVSDGSTITPSRLTIESRDSGRAGRLFIETDGIDLGLANTAEADDAVAIFGPGAGYVLTSGSNRFTDLPGGFDLDLLSESTTSKVTVAADSSSVRTAVQSFVTNYNAAVKSIKDQTAYNAETQKRGVLQGDSFVLRVEDRLRSMVSTRFGDSDTLRNLSSIGVTANAKGELEFDRERFDAVAAESPEELERLFTGDRGFGEKLGLLVEDLTNSQTGDFTIRKDSLDTRVKGVTDRIESLTERMVARRDRLFAEFVRMEQALADLQSQQLSISSLVGLPPVGR